MNWRETLLKMRASPLGERLIKISDIDIPWRLPGVDFPVYLQTSKNLSELLFGGKEAAERELFRKIAAYQEMAEFWDIGANIGQYSWEFVSSGPGKRALMFEPDERNIKTLRRTIARSSLMNCAIKEAAASDTIGRLEFKRDTITGKQGTIVRDAKIEQYMGRPASLVSIACTTLDQTSKELGRAPQLLKVDVEGAEISVIEGAAATLSAHRPVIVIEILSKNFEPIRQKLAPLGYLLYDAVTGQKAHPQSFNVLAIAPDQWPKIHQDISSVSR